MKKVLCLTVILLLLPAFFVFAGGKEKEPEAMEKAAPAPAPEAKRVLRVTFSWPTYIDPSVGSDFSSSSSFVNLYDTLVYPTSEGAVVPHLAERWEALLAEAGSPAASALAILQDEVRVLFHGRREVGQVALTIDDGPHPLITPLMLAILKENDVQATFFIVGKKAEEYPALVRMIVGDGHELGNHAYSNRRLHDLSVEEAWAEVEACHRIVGRITGESMTYFRPPGGVCSPDGLRAVGSLGYTTAFWTRNTGDWRKPPAAEIVHNALTGLEAGDIILMHQGDMCSVRALPRIIKGIRAMGLEPTTVGEVDRNGGALRDTPEALTELLNSRWLGRE